ncbi:alpha/beta-Hydrolases superfamily protein [Striga asiatica]|uniref:Alpha/beta-Hydrolases superfamily protein n=1 Tax=Striga asiatica TaxID=4170 RepID=A0A5A7PVR7_STRAF|nr:alpha/beta-Hydrolases superfamily protein [Striga asiatica]
MRKAIGPFVILKRIQIDYTYEEEPIALWDRKYSNIFFKLRRRRRTSPEKGSSCSQEAATLHVSYLPPFSWRKQVVASFSAKGSKGRAVILVGEEGQSLSLPSGFILADAIFPAEAVVTRASCRRSCRGRELRFFSPSLEKMTFKQASYVSVKVSSFQRAADPLRRCRRIFSAARLLPASSESRSFFTAGIVISFPSKCILAGEQQVERVPAASSLVAPMAASSRDTATSTTLTVFKRFQRRKGGDPAWSVHTYPMRYRPVYRFSYSYQSDIGYRFPKSCTEAISYVRPGQMSKAFHMYVVTSLIAALSAASATVLGAYTLAQSEDSQHRAKLASIYSEVDVAIERSNESVNRILNRMRQTGVAASVLWQSLRSVLSSANHEVRAGFELRVAALLADIDGNGTQAESARALAYLIADPNVCEVVFGRPRAVPNLLRFIFSAQPKRSKKAKQSSFHVSDKGKSMLVAAVMDVVTSNCESVEKLSFSPLLPKDAEMRDIAAAIAVIEEGGMQWDEQHGDEDDDGGKGMKGIGIKVLGGATVLGFSETGGYADVDHSDSYDTRMISNASKNLLFSRMSESSHAQLKLHSAVVPGLWDDLDSEHVAIPFAAWALANWAMASEVNRAHIQELDRDGHAVMSALVAPERSVKWHGSWLAQLLLEDRNLPLNNSVSDWSSSLLSTISQASKTQDIPLAQLALSALLVSIDRSPEAQEVVMDKGLHSMREASKQMANQKAIQESLAKALELISSRELHMSLEESQKWSAILLSWVFGKVSSDAIRSSAINILSRILEDYGPSSVPISQGWLTILLTDALSCRKATLAKVSAQLTSDKVKTQIDLSNVVSATQTANQLATAVVNLAGAQLGTAIDSADAFPLADLLSLEPFVGLFKNLKKDKTLKITAADSANATLKGIKALTEICADDPSCLDKIADFGVLCLLRRFLLDDDYEQLAAIEAYDASRAMEAQEKVSSTSGDSSVDATHDPSNLRVPATAHVRRHAARLLTVLSVLPKVQKAIVADKSWYKWLEECARGQIPGCNDLKIQSYARATLLNAFCSYLADWKSESDGAADSRSLNKKQHCPHFSDMIFLINPGLSHWKCTEQRTSNSSDKSTGSDDSAEVANGNLSRTMEDGNNPPASTSESESFSNSEFPPLDVVFVHGLRGGPFKTWRLSEDKSSTKSGLVEKIDEEAGKQGTFWPGEWLAADFSHARLFSLKYKTNLTQWSGASLPLQFLVTLKQKEVIGHLLEICTNMESFYLVSILLCMGGLVVKQMLYQARTENKDNFVENTVGIVFYSCPHFGSKLADMPWRMGLVLRPAPTIGELRSGSPRLVELNDFVRQLHKKKLIDVLSFCETKVTPIVEGYGGWAFRMEIVPMESAYPGFGELVVLDSTDHVNSCKPLSRTDPSYKDTLDFLQRLRSHYS